MWSWHERYAIAWRIRNNEKVTVWSRCLYAIENSFGGMVGYDFQCSANVPKKDGEVTGKVTRVLERRNRERSTPPRWAS